MIEAFEGAPPAGWLSPWISQSRVTARPSGGARLPLLPRLVHGRPAGWFSTRAGGRILAVPYPQEVNDIPSIVARKDSAEQFADMIVDNFTEMLEQAIDTPLVMGIALHSYLVGQPYRLRHDVADHRERISITTAGAIASHVMALDDRE